MSESSNNTAVRSSSDLPPPRQKRALRSVSPPLSNVSLHRFNYYLAIFATLLFALYTYKLIQWKADAGSWWNLMLGKRPPMMQGNGGPQGGNDWQVAGTDGRGDMSVEQRINELALALGMPSKDLASAIANVVREYVPPASLSSISAHQSGEAVSYLVDPSGASVSATETQTAVTENVTKGLGTVASVIEAAIGMDEPPTEMA
ncbi:hypothetical protein QCA50_001162 [Cerrena zonata]|uniref:Uncharacterized protein n=1 Tax=Cerrena zonata TaxID=2478898 RepID=A0AAW0H0V1_9APHY